MRDEVIDYVRYWSDRTELAGTKLVGWIGISRSKYYHWRTRYGKVNEHNAWIPRDWWLEDWEKQAIQAFALDHRLEGYRRLTYMMLDADVVAVSPSSVYRVLKDADLLGGWNRKPSKKGRRFALQCCWPVKRKRALLESNPPGIAGWDVAERRRREQLSRAAPEPPSSLSVTFPHALENSSAIWGTAPTTSGHTACHLPPSRRRIVA